MEEHNNITYIPPPSKTGEEVVTSPLEMKQGHDNITYIPPPSKTGEEVVASPLEMKKPQETKDHTLKQELETAYSPEKTARAPTDREVENVYSPEKASMTGVSADREVEKVYSPEKASRGPIDRDVGLARIESDKRMSMIKAWEDSKKAKADNKAQKKMSSILSWENTERASIEAKLRKKQISLEMKKAENNFILPINVQEALERRKAENTEKLNNKVATIHREAESKRAAIEAKHGKAIVDAEEMAAKYRATGAVPNKKTWCCDRAY